MHSSKIFQGPRVILFYTVHYGHCVLDVHYLMYTIWYTLLDIRYLLYTDHLVNKANLDIHWYFLSLTLHIIDITLIYAFLNNTDYFWTQKPRRARSRCMMHVQNFSVSRVKIAMTSHLTDPQIWSKESKILGYLQWIASFIKYIYCF